MKLEDDCFLEGKHRQYIEKQRHHFANKDPCSQGYGLSSSHMWMWELDHNEGCTEGLLPSNCGAGEDLGQQENQTIVNPKGSQPWILNGRTDAEAEAPVLWPPGVKSQLIRKDPDAGKDWRQKEKRATEDEMVGWHHWLNEHELEQTPRDGEGRGRECCSPWGRKESDMTWWLNNNNPPKCFNISRWSSFTLGLGVINCLWSGPSESEYMSPFKSSSQMARILWVSGHKPCWFSKRDILGLSSACDKSWAAQCGVLPLASQEEALAFQFPVRFMVRLYPNLFHPPQCGFLLTCPICSCQLARF